MSYLMGFVNTIIIRIANENEIEERLVNVMGGRIIETQTEIWMKQGKVQMLIEMANEDGLDDLEILHKLQEKIGLSLEDAKAYLKKYGKQSV